MKQLRKPEINEEHRAAIDAVTAALANSPVIAIPEHFAAHVAALAVIQPAKQPSLQFGWGQRLVLLSTAVLLAGMFILAAHAAPSLTNWRFDAELIAFAELVGLLMFARPLLFPIS